MSDPILARALVNPQSSVVASAEAVAGHVVAALRVSPTVQVDLTGLRGVPSTFFNVVLLAVATNFGAEALSGRVLFIFGSDAQRLIYQRSLAAVRAQFPEHAS